MECVPYIYLTAVARINWWLGALGWLGRERTEILPTNVRYKIVTEFIILLLLYFGDRLGLVDFRVETGISLYSIIFNVINKQNISSVVFNFLF